MARISKKAPPKSGKKNLLEKIKKDRVSSTVNVAVPQKKKSKNMIRLITVQESKKSTRIRINDNTKIKKASSLPGKELVKHTPLLPAVPTPYRFPVPREQFIGNMARYGGVLLVVIGGFFSLVHVSVFDDTYGVVQQAQTYAVRAEGMQASINMNARLTNREPKPDIRVDGDEILSIVAPVQIIVPNATAVRVVFHNQDTGSYIPMNAIRVDATTWRYDWLTVEFPDGSYRLKVFVTNEYGTYDYTDSQTFTVSHGIKNDLERLQSLRDIVEENDMSLRSSVREEGVYEAADTEEKRSLLYPTLNLEENTRVEGSFVFRVHAPDASLVRMYARNAQTGVFSYIGYGLSEDQIVWNVDFDSRTLTDGTYQVYAKAVINTETYEGIPVMVSVRNQNTSPALSKDEESMRDGIPDQISAEATARLILPDTESLSGTIAVDIETSPSESVELYVMLKGSFSSSFVGRAQKIRDTTWRYTWDTTQTPNGKYTLYARVKNQYGFTDGEGKDISITNTIVQRFTREQESLIDTVRTLQDILVGITDTVSLDGAESVQTRDREVIYVQSVDSYLQEGNIEDDVRSEIRILLSSFRTALDQKLILLAQTKRNNDEEARMRVESEIDVLKTDVLAQSFEMIGTEEARERITMYVKGVSGTLQEVTIRNEKILSEQSESGIFQDSDNDGVSDYDEIQVYGTNPFVADTDGDGYIDGVEIALGYDPRDSRIESRFVYQSPKSGGLVRTDIFAVESIVAFKEEVSEQDSAPRKALISGQGLPYSFVNLYIFSTPIVVTVKTDAEGKWNYVLDKELEEGNHEIYVGITDNTGSIVAKSNPLSFIKTAEAFEILERDETVIVVESVEGIIRVSEKAMLLIASVTIVALGLTLILLGLHVHARPKNMTAPVMHV